MKRNTAHGRLTAIERFQKNGSRHPATIASVGDDSRPTQSPHSGTTATGATCPWCGGSASESGKACSACRCARCDGVVPAGAARCPGCGIWRPRNQAARQHGAYARHQPIDLRLTSDELVAGIVADLGGETELSTLERAYVRRLGDVAILCQALAADIARRGLMTESGARVRDVYDKLLAGILAFDRLATRVGLKRRMRRAPTLAEYLERNPNRQGRE